MKNHKNIGFLSNTGSTPPKNHKATKPAFNVAPSSDRQRNAIKMTFRWRADDGLWILSSTIKKEKKKTLSKLDPIWKNFLDPRKTLRKRELVALLYLCSCCRVTVGVLCFFLVGLWIGILLWHFLLTLTCF